MKIKILMFAAVVFALSAAPLYAQAAPEVVAGAPYRVAADHNGVDTIGYRVYVDNVKVGNDLPLAALVAGVVTSVDLPGVARGAHTIQVAAYNEDNEVKSDPLSFTAKKKAPGKPTNTRIVLVANVASNGSVTFSVQEVTTEDVDADGNAVTKPKKAAGASKRE